MVSRLLFLLEVLEETPEAPEIAEYLFPVPSLCENCESRFTKLVPSSSSSSSENAPIGFSDNFLDIPRIGFLTFGRLLFSSRFVEGPFVMEAPFVEDLGAMGGDPGEMESRPETLMFLTFLLENGDESSTTDGKMVPLILGPFEEEEEMRFEEERTSVEPV